MGEFDVDDADVDVEANVGAIELDPTIQEENILITVPRLRFSPARLDAASGSKDSSVS